MARWPSGLLLILVLVGVVGCDHAGKQLAARRLGEAQALNLIPGVLELRRVENTDTAFNLLGGVLEPSGRRALILCLQGGAIVALLGLAIRRRRESRTLERVAAGLVLGGAVGNFGDRLIRGSVTDFIHVPYWPVFNVADIALCVGIGLLVLAFRNEPIRGIRG
ncbi:MAG: signal peptidase II [Polyangiaceae bacterium]|nr:signal peptidase II [Polyangiaceae bacterium]